MRLYPDPVHIKLREVISEQYNFNIKEIFVGNGSDEILSLIFRTFVDPDDTVIIPYPDYILFETLADIEGIKHKYVDFGPLFGINDLSVLSKIESKLILFSNPNTPTGNFISVNKMPSQSP